MGVVKNIMVRAVADFSALTSASQKASSAMKGLGESMNKSLRGVESGGIAKLAIGLGGIADKLLLLAGIGISLDYLKDATNDAVSFDAKMQTLNERMGQASVGFQKWANTVGKSMGYSKVQIATYGNTFSNMLMDASANQQDLAEKTEKIMQASAIIRAKTGLKQEEVSERIRSAMNQEADGADELGINVRTTAVEHSNAFKTLAKGVKNFSDLNSGMQKAVMLQYILDETTRRYGSTLADNVSTHQAQFVASLADLKLSLGQAILPIWNAVLPALSSMVNWLDLAAQRVGAFMRVLFGFKGGDTASATANQTDAIANQAKAVGGLSDANDKLAKAKKGVASFDEVNVLADDSKDGAGTAGGAIPASKGLDSGSNSGSTNSMFPEVEKFAEKVKNAIASVKEKLGEIGDWFSNNKDIVISALVGIGAGFLVAFGGAIAVMIEELITGALASLMLALEEVAVAMLAVDWPVVLIILGVALLAAGITYLVFHWDEFKEAWKKGWDSAWTKTKEVGKWIADKFDEIVKAIKQWAISVGEHAESAYNSMIQTFKDIGSWFKTNVIDPVVDWFVYMGTQIGLKASSAWDSVTTAFAEGATWFKTQVIDPIVGYWDDLKTKTGEKWEEIKTTLKEKWNNIVSLDWEGVKTSVVTMWDSLKTKTGEKWEDIKGAVKEKWDLLVNMDFSGVSTGLVAIWNTLKTDTDTIWQGIVTAVKNSVNSVIDGINAFINTVNGLKINIPSVNIPGIGEVGGGSIGMPHIPTIPRLAKGGITNGAMIAMIGDNPGGQEVVSPLDKLSGYVTSAVMQAMAFSQPSTKRDQGGDVILNIDGRQFARIIKPYTDQETKRVGGTTVTLNTI